MLLKAKKLISTMLAVSFVVTNPMGVQGIPSATTLTIDAQINNDNGKVTFELRDYTDHLAHVTVTDIE